ncbi:MAG: hypothetical protein Cons2KO_30250 [Congregibacter sp.]
MQLLFQRCHCIAVMSYSIYSVVDYADRIGIQEFILPKCQPGSLTDSSDLVCDAR